MKVFYINRGLSWDNRLSFWKYRPGMRLTLEQEQGRAYAGLRLFRRLA